MKRVVMKLELWCSYCYYDPSNDCENPTYGECYCGGFGVDVHQLEL